MPEHTVFWKQYLATLAADHPHHQATYEAWGFGDSPAMADELGRLVMDGIKTATASLLKEYEVENESVPQVGDFSIILDGREQPMCIIETTEVNIKPFHRVDAQFAYDEGEDDRTLESWIAGHERFFKRQCAGYGWEFSHEMLIVFERFNVVYRASQDNR